MDSKIETKPEIDGFSGDIPDEQPAPRESWRERLMLLKALPEREQNILRLAKGAMNAMGFACQGAELQNERMEIRYQEQAENLMRELEDFLLGDSHAAE